MAKAKYRIVYEHEGRKMVTVPLTKNRAEKLFQEKPQTTEIVKIIKARACESTKGTEKGVG